MSETQKPKVVLPTAPVPPSRVNPRNLLLIGLPKVGKTTIISKLDNCLIIDLEQGTDFLEAMKIPAKSVQDIVNICVAIKEANYPYKFIAIDTITMLEELCGKVVLTEYKKEKPDYTGTWASIEYGRGTQKVKEMMSDIQKLLESVCPNVIWVGHIKDRSLNLADNGSPVTVKDINLTGSLGSAFSAKVDAVGFIVRDSVDGSLIIDFNTANSIISGSRVTRLSGKQFKIVDGKNPNEKPHWEYIYPTINKSSKNE